MALLNINPATIGQSLGTTAASKVAQKVVQSMSPKLVRDVQRVISVGGQIGNLLGASTGIDLLDNLLSLGSVQDKASPLLGGLTLAQAKSIHQQLRAAEVTRKNLFFLRITDSNPPSGSYLTGPQAQSPYSASGLGAAASDVVSGISGIAGRVVNAAASSVMGRLGLGSAMDGLGIGQIALDTFDLLALDVAFGAQVVSDHVQVGSSFIDKPTGLQPQEVQITTMDDGRGSIKRWFEGKVEQIAHPDGTVGLPADYLVTIEIVLAVPSAEVPTEHLAYRKYLRLRPQSINIDHSRRDQAIAELQMTFSQFDAFMGI